MKTCLLAMVLVVGAAAGACAVDSSATTGTLAADFGGRWLNHPDTTLSALRGKVVLIEVWRTW